MTTDLNRTEPDDIRVFGSKPSKTSTSTVAYDVETDTILYAEDRPTEEWKSLTYPKVKEGSIICVDCYFQSGKTVKRRVQFRAGTKKMAHFAHLPGEAPDGTLRHGETADHLRGKRMIYDWLQKQGVVKEVNYEFWIPTKKRISDIQATLHNGTVVGFEIQRWDINDEDWAARHGDYVDAGVKDVWLWSTDVKEPRLLKESLNSVAFDSKLEKVGSLFVHSDPEFHLSMGFSGNKISTRLKSDLNTRGGSYRKLVWFADKDLDLMYDFRGHPSVKRRRSYKEKYRAHMISLNEWALSDTGDLVYPDSLQYLIRPEANPEYAKLHKQYVDLNPKITSYLEWSQREGPIFKVAERERLSREREQQKVADFESNVEKIFDETMKHGRGRPWLLKKLTAEFQKLDGNEFRAQIRADIEIIRRERLLIPEVKREASKVSVEGVQTPGPFNQAAIDNDTYALDQLKEQEQYYLTRGLPNDRRLPAVREQIANVQARIDKRLNN